MTEISEAAKAKACELANAPENSIGDYDPAQIAESARKSRNSPLWALARFIQEVSDAAKEATSRYKRGASPELTLAPLILPEPVDPLLGVVEEAIAGTAEKGAIQLREALAKRGLKIVPVQS